MKKFILFLFVLSYLLLSSAYTWAEVSGSWDVIQIEKISFSAKGLKTVKDVIETDSVWQFTSNSFECDDFSGSWSQKNNNFAVYANKEEIAENYRLIVEYLGYDVSVVVSKVTVSGKVQKDGTIKGKYSISANLIFNDLNGAKGKLSISGVFSGSRIDNEPESKADYIWGLSSTIWKDNSGYIDYSYDKVIYNTTVTKIAGYFLKGGKESGPHFELIRGRHTQAEYQGDYYGSLNFEFDGNDGLHYLFTGNFKNNDIEGSWGTSDGSKMGFFKGKKLN